MPKLKVAIVMPTHFDIHSSLNNFIKTYQYMIKTKDVEVTLLTDKSNDIKVDGFKIEKISGIDYNTVFEKILFILGIPRYYYKDLKNKLKDYDVINANNPEFYAYAYQSYKAAKKHNKRFILRTSQTVDGFFLYKVIKPIINKIIRRSYDYAKFCIFTNPEAKDRALRLNLIDKNKETIITGHATDTNCFIPERKEKKTTLLSVGGLLELKGHHLIIKALKKLRDENIDAKLNIVGKGPYEESLRSLVKELKLESHVNFLGTKGHEELKNLYNQATVFVLANFQEITPAVNEALACETPVVVMDCGGREFVIPDESYGLISKKMDVEDMKEKIKKLINDKDLRISIAKKGRKHILDNFSIEKVSDKIYKAFTK